MACSKESQWTLVTQKVKNTSICQDKIFVMSFQNKTLKLWLCSEYIKDFVGSGLTTS